TVQVAAAAIVTSAGVGIKILYNPFAGDYFLHSPVWVWCLTIGWIVVVTNSINLIDGLDGLASGVCFITASTLFFIAKDLGSPHLPYFALGLAGACLGFLIFNFSPARIFLGDSGSLFLGFLLACLSIMGTTKRSTAIVMFGPPLILALPVADTLFAVVRRFLRRVQTGEIRGSNWAQFRRSFFVRLREVFRADQEHIHHGLLKIGLSHRRAVILLYCVTAVLGTAAYRVAVEAHLWGTALIFILLSTGLFVIRYKVGRR
ncbi:MAG: undecaprenyl/decaprenyl-phosphate alpha-N-acetylglucosaminyl 1-phosphate transferase, partial [Bdellovibrionales bacterium]|nr:undecaprenyl/decaprenyl-phosphate alpha-N-acetylglucosaminyl 1-phosphate transferase [Bdellovibrionales bacterium]